MTRNVIYLVLLSVFSLPLWAEKKQNTNTLKIAGLDEITLESGVTLVGQRSSGTANNESRAAYSVDLAFKGQMGKHGYVYVGLRTAEGSPLNVNSVVDVNENNESGQFNNTKLSEAWFDICLSDQTYLRLGKIDTTRVYDGNEVANDGSTQFLNTALVNNAAIPFPAYTAGANFTYEMKNKKLKINVGAYEPGQDFQGAMDDAFLIAEVALALGDSNLRLTAWDCNACPVTGPPVLMKNNGFALNADHALGKEFKFFFRYGAMDQPMDAAFDAAASLGASWRVNKKAEAAFGYSSLMATAGNDDENHVELYYKYQWAQNVTFTADVQMITSPGLSSANDDATVFGIRTQVDF